MTLPAGPLPVIPLVDLGTAGLDRLALDMPDKVRLLSAAGRSLLSAPMLALMDRRSKAWLARNETPYRAEIDAIAAIPGVAGAHGLNLSPEWACTSASADGRLVRILDWPIHGLGGAIVVARHRSEAGAWYNVTWPGFVGVLTGMAPGRFAISYNQAPVRARTGIWPLDWLLERIHLGPRRAIPATHLIRRAFETCRTYAEAFRLLKQTPIAYTGLITLAGPAGEAAIIERVEDQAIVHEGPGAIPNHWLNPHWRGHPRGVDSPGRLSQCRLLLPGLRHLEHDFRWLQYPMLNKFGRLAVIADLKTGDLAVMGLERGGDHAVPGTECFKINVLAN
ncbi:C45 family peptidase [Dongia sp. agr-C8]